MRLTDIIIRKRDGHALTQPEIEGFVEAVTAGTVPDYQVSALLMAIVLRGMTDQETSWLTGAMARSGDRVDLSGIPGTKVGKHSTGGVGDKVSILLAPIVASCGAVMPKMSGRGLGHTGGTLDKLESIPGFRVDLSIDEFRGVLRRVGTSIIGQTNSLAPADRKLYALRDVTATVSGLPLIAASIMSKKIAEGADALVLDVKCGQGAFTRSEPQARELARLMVAIGRAAGIRTEALITGMDGPLGAAVGNSLELIECIEGLQGRLADDLQTVVHALAARMLVLAGVADEQGAEQAVRRAIESGAALEKLRALIEAQGGDPRVVDDYTRLPAATRHHAIRADRTGTVQTLRADLIGRASMALGAGRSRVDDRIDHGAGILIAAKPGTAVKAGDPVLELLFNDGYEPDEAAALAREAVVISDSIPRGTPLIIDVVR
jgi:pyrimidine-nucleoside phosphorylase